MNAAAEIFLVVMVLAIFVFALGIVVNSRPTPLSSLHKLISKRYEENGYVDDIGDYLVDVFIDKDRRVILEGTPNRCVTEQKDVQIADADAIWCTYRPKTNSVKFLFSNGIILERSDIANNSSYWLLSKQLNQG